jgi:Rrf2 family protein
MPRPSTRFSVGVHVLVALSYRPDKLISSASLSNTVATNSVVIRRVLAKLRDAGLVVSQTGAAGGTRLARSAETISLLHVYRAVGESDVFSLHSPNPDCPIGRCIPDVLESVLPRVERAMEAELAKISIREVARKVVRAM